MRNTVLILINVVLVAIVIALLLFQRPKALEVDQTRQAGHGTRPRHDHKGNAVDTEDCPIRTGQDKKTCIIPISYLTDMINSGGTDTAIEVFRKDTIKWVGDNGETIAVQPMPGVDCSIHAQSDPPPQGDASLIGPVTTVGTGNIQYAQVTANANNDFYCYKTNITVTLNGKTTPIDPHIFDGGP